VRRAVERWRNTTSNARIRDYYIPQVCGLGKWRSPIHAADKISAAVLLIHGDHDTRVPTEQSLIMQEALRTATRHVELQLIAGGEHGFTHGQSEQAWSLVMRFLGNYSGETQ